MKTIDSPSITPEHPARLAIFGQPPLLKGEKLADYKNLFARIWNGVKPTDVFEEFWVQDLVDHVWVVNRLRRQKAALLNANQYHGVRELLRPRLTRIPPKYGDESVQAAGWAQGDQTFIAHIKETFRSSGVTMDAVSAQTLVINVNNIERLDRMITVAEERRNITLREIDRHRAAFGDKLRRQMQVIEDAEFEEVGAKADETPLLEEKETEQEVNHVGPA